MNDSKLCDDFYEFQHSFHLKIISWIQISLSLVSGLFLLLIWIFIGIPTNLNNNVKLLIKLSLFFFIFHNFCLVVNQTRVQITYMSSLECSLFPAWSCMIVRVTQLYCYVIMYTSNTLVLVDRAFATWRPKNYENIKKFLPFYYYLVTALFSTLLVFITVYENPIQPFRPYCTYTNDMTTTRVTHLFFVFFGITIVSIVVFTGLWMCNSRDLSRKSHKFDINSHYFLKTNDWSLKFMLESTTLSFVVNGGFLLAHFCVRIFVQNVGKAQLLAYLESTYIIPLQAACSAIVLIHFAKYKRNKLISINRSSHSDHFNHLNNLWKFNPN